MQDKSHVNDAVRDKLDKMAARDAKTMADAMPAERTTDSNLHAAAQELGAAGGKKRDLTTSESDKKAIAREGAKARWG